MAQIILMHSNKTLRDLLALNLQTYVAAEVIVRENAQEARALLDILPQIELVLTQDKISDEDSSVLIAQYLGDKNSHTQLIVMGSFDPLLLPNAIVVSNPMNWEEALEKAGIVLGVTVEMVQKRVRPEYIAIDATYFYQIESTPSDVYLKLKKGPGEFHYVKRLHAGDNFNAETINRYLEGGLKQFHIPKADHFSFVTFVSNALVAKLENGNMELTEELQITATGFGMAHREITRLGLSSVTIQLAEAVIESMIRTIEKSPQMGSLLTKILNGPDRYSYQLSHLASAIALELLDAKKLSTHENRLKIVYSSFFCDLALVDDDNWCRINTFNELDHAGLSEADWDKVFSHAVDAAIFVRKYPELPLGADRIIKEHHGATHGKGFSVTSFEEISELSRIYFIAEQVARQLLKYRDERQSERPLLDQLRLDFKEIPLLLELLDLLQKSFQKKMPSQKN